METIAKTTELLTMDIIAFMEQKNFFTFNPKVGISSGSVPFITFLSNDKHPVGHAYEGKPIAQNIYLSRGAGEELVKNVTPNTAGEYIVTPEYVLDNLKLSFADCNAAGEKVWKLTRKQGENAYISLDLLKRKATTTAMANVDL